MEWLKGLVYGAQAITSPLGSQEIAHAEAVEIQQFPTKVITFDGGGMRGLYTIELMKAVESHLNGKITDHTHVISGTSTGTILGYGLGVGKSLDALDNLYKTHGQEIFYQTAWEYFKDGDGLIGPKYDYTKLEQLLQENFGQRKLSDFTQHHVMAFATDITQQTVKIFDSKMAQKDPQEDVPAWFAIRSSTAAPTYFAPTEWKGNALCDGGLLVNNPNMATIIQLKDVYGWNVLENLKMVSFGTGTFPTGISYHHASGMGALEWVIPISDMIMKSSSNMYDKFSDKLLTNGRLVRLNGNLPKDLALDDYSSNNLKAIGEAALTYIKNNPEMIDRAAKTLQN